VTITREKFDLKDERDIIIGMAISDLFCSSVKKMISDYRFFTTSYNRKLVKWIIEYHEQHGNAPKTEISNIFLFHRNELKDEELGFMEEVLRLIQDAIPTALHTFNYDLSFDRAEKYLRKQSLLQAAANIKGYAEQDKLSEAENVMADFKKVKKDLGFGLDPLRDNTIVQRIFEQNKEPLFTIPGAIGEAMTKLYRGDLIGIAGASKAGKSYLLMQFAKYALLDGLKVAYFSLEMNDEQNAERLFSGFIAKGLDRISQKIVPIINEDGMLELTYANCDGATENEIEHMRKMVDLAIGTGGIRIFDVESAGCTIPDISSTLTNLSYYENWDADVVIIDYADILENDRNYKDSWIGEDAKWKGMKREIAQKHKCLCISASQLNREALKVDKTGVEHTSGSVSKFNHVSLWLSLSMTPEEKKAGLVRCTIQGRHGDYDTVDEFVITRCLSIGRPIIDSARMSEIKNYHEYIQIALSGGINIEDEKQ